MACFSIHPRNAIIRLSRLAGADGTRGQHSSLPQSVNQFDTICPVAGFCFRNIYLYLYVYREIDISGRNWQIQRWSWQRGGGATMPVDTLGFICQTLLCSICYSIWINYLFEEFLKPSVGYREKIEELEWKNKSLLSENYPQNGSSA